MEFLIYEKQRAEVALSLVIADDVRTMRHLLFYEANPAEVLTVGARTVPRASGAECNVASALYALPDALQSISPQVTIA